ncbi:HotDog domain [Phytophthora cactorum]|nr:HotDog domain [Phytophthora cactorum]
MLRNPHCTSTFSQNVLQGREVSEGQHHDPSHPVAHGAGVLRRKLTPQVPGALLRYPGVWKTRASLKDCNFMGTLPENAYYRSMELAIWYGCGVQGILHACVRNRWYFVFGSQGIRHFKDIKLFQRYEVHTRNVYWDDDWLFLLAQFKCPDTGRSSPREMGVDGLPHQHEMPEVIQKFLQWDMASEVDMKTTAEANAAAIDSSRKPSFVSAYSMNLPFQRHVHGHEHHMKGDSM